MSGAGDANELTGVVSGSATLISRVGRDVHITTGARGPAGSLPYRSGAVPVVVDGFQRRSMPELDTATVGGVVLSGLGGVGKTQAAADYADRAWRDGVELVGWVTASTRANVVTALAELGGIVTGEAVDDAEKGARRFLDWCASTRHRWLVVFDDVADPAELTGLWPHPGASGRLVVTTRRNEPWTLRTSTRLLTPVGAFTSEQSTAYLRAVLGELDVAELASLLGHLPLALGQAAAYIAMVPGMTCANYVRQWRAQRAALSRMFPADRAGADGRTDTVATTWSISIEAADRLDPVGSARPMLALMSVLDPHGIPLRVLTSAPVRQYLSADGGESTARALGCLQRFNLVTIDRDRPTPVVRVHALVQQVAREQLSSTALAETARTAAGALLVCWPPVERDTGFATMLRANAAALSEHAEQHLWQLRRHAVLFRAANSLGTAGQVSAAITHYRRLHATVDRVFGPDHPETLKARHNLAGWLGESGDVLGAVQSYIDLLADRLRVQSADHPDVLGTRANLARWQGESGDAAGAAQAYIRLLDEQLRVLSPDHPHNLVARANLAHMQGQSGDAEGAVRAYTELLADQLRVQGPDHPDTLTTRANLAHWHGESGDARKAVRAYTEVLTDQLDVLSPDHPHTLRTRGNLARWLGESGDIAGAVRAYADVLADQLRVLAPDHPDTLTTRHNAAHWRGESGDALGAAQAFEELLADQIRVQGAEHPDTLKTRGNLARRQGESGDVLGAARAFEELLVDRIRVQGAMHRSTVETRANAAHWRARAGLSSA
ncbi:tetratricopeptide repeat protein [Actinokineospora enzanensis]|uniref:tetratricopeptide repeat protein n=1 Tax=Actinokineospora enzanensis TaxID=155975 RepID=UPI001B7F9156|nr:tetratricopeptide repeat protein [Actinokineospora enzanensis]